MTRPNGEARWRAISSSGSLRQEVLGKHYPVTQWDALYDDAVWIARLGGEGVTFDRWETEAAPLIEALVSDGRRSGCDQDASETLGTAMGEGSLEQGAADPEAPQKGDDRHVLHLDLTVTPGRYELQVPDKGATVARDENVTLVDVVVELARG